MPLAATLDRRARWLLLISLMLAMFVSALNQSVVATATPQMLADLGGFSLLSWVFTVYMLTSTVITPLVGKLSDMFGRKGFLLAGIAVFTVGSALCGVATNMPLLITYRAIQGFGGGVIMSCVFATLGDLFSPAERGKYIGLFTGTFTIAGLSGPTIGGLLTDHVTWRLCFFINVPFAIVAVLAIAANLPAKERAKVPLRSIDFVGAALLSAATTSLLLGLAWAQREYGWQSLETAGLFVATAVLLVAFLLQERRHEQAVLPLHIFKNREFAIASAVAMVLGAGTMGATQYLPTFVQTSLGSSATASGLVTTPQSLGMLFSSIIGGQILSRTGRYRAQCIIGVSLVLAGSICLSTLDVGQPEWRIMGYMAVMGLGSGLVMPTMSVVSQNALPQQLMGVATSARQFFMQIGNVLGVAVFGVVLANSYHAAFDRSVDPATRAALAPEVLAQFDDPTLALNKRLFERASAEVLKAENGQAVLEDTLDAQRTSVADAIRHIYYGAIAVIGLALVLVVCLKGLPLRRAPTPASSAPPARAPAGGPAPGTSPAGTGVPGTGGG
jgi:EmrB/QacA subfamily drug resistance transporter